MEAQSEFEVLFHDSIDKLDMTPGSIVNATVIDIRNDYVVIREAKGVIGIYGNSPPPKLRRVLALCTVIVTFVSEWIADF